MERAVTCYALLHIVSIPIVLFAFFVCPSPAFSQGPVKIFLYAGQSNAEGVLASENSNLFPSSSFDEEIMYAWNLKGGNVTLNSGWNHLRKVPMGSRQITHAGEITAGRKIYGAGLTEVAFIKVTKGGTSLNRDWDPQSGNGMYAHMKEYIERKLRELDDRGIPYTIEAIFWHQGEGDTSPSFAAQYERNLQEFIDF
ncbi:MAG: sialate O-acetylesterase, partial [Bacteroidota bacterium]